MRVTRLCHCIGLFFLCVFSPFVCAQSNQDAQAIAKFRAQPITDEEFKLSVEKQREPEVDRLIGQLGSPDFKTREAAAGDLIQIGAATFSKLREAYHKTSDLETRLRIEEITRRGYLNYHVLDKHGFLGVSMGSFDPAQLNRSQLREPFNQIELPPGRVGVYVSQVIPNTGAERAGIKPNDVVIGINGEAVSGEGQAIRDSFSAIIRNTRPGETVDLEIVRGKEVMHIKAVLHRPPEDAGQRRIIVVSDLVDVASERFEVWWKKYFLKGEKVATQED